MDPGNEKILSFFKQVSQIPRCSKNEAEICRWLEKWAQERGWEKKKDSAGNLVIKVPATKGREKSPVVILQGHMDMVCEKDSDSEHDFSKDPIDVQIEGDWVRARGTSLGADNGIGIALALTAAFDDSISHGPLALLFTVDEETGLTGASAMATDLLDGKILMNLDSEQEGVFIVGCAGGKDTRISIPVTSSKILGKKQEYFSLQVQGLRGGHSGVDIHRQRANAIKILARCLMMLVETAPIMLVSLNGGKAHNAIPRLAKAEFACIPGKADDLREKVAGFEKTIQKEFEGIESSIKISMAGPIEEPCGENNFVSHQETIKISQLLCALPHGIVAMSKNMEGLVETSCNLAVINLDKQTIEIITSQRSSVMSRLEEITGAIKAAAHLAGASTSDENSYPAWEPSMDSPLLERSKNVYKALFQKEPKVDVIHAGLECAVIGAKYPGMDLISFGPTIEGAHGPEERLFIPSVDRTWKFLKSLLNSLAGNF